MLVCGIDKGFCLVLALPLIIAAYRSEVGRYPYCDRYAETEEIGYPVKFRSGKINGAAVSGNTVRKGFDRFHDHRSITALAALPCIGISGIELFRVGTEHTAE